MRALLEREFLFVAGKGGAGKTTVSAALALAAARHGKRVLVAMCNARERLSTLLEVDPIGPRNTPVLPGIEAVNMRPDVALEEYGMMVLRVRAVYRAVLENRVISAFVRGTPGVEAWTMLGKAYFHVHERLADGRPRYDLVVFDAPATGHALDMLRVPEVIREVAPPGLLRREAERALDMLRDSRRSAAVLVTLPEEMPVTETVELYRALARGPSGPRIPVGTVVINAVLPPLLHDVDPASLDAAARSAGPLSGLAAAGRWRASRERVQRAAIARLAAALDGVPRIELPHVFASRFGRAAVQALGARLVDTTQGGHDATGATFRP
ncbi:MAG: ArsA family ATPase [Myxococcota bacterium]|nr:ArsA family ATPase [Myxococcota bacterium]MDW8362473.1 ArsA family ATPase [Myxococcales bacterium]